MLQRKGKGISFPCTFAQDLYEKINLNPAFTLSHSTVETIIAMKSLVILSARVIFIELIQGLVKVLVNSTQLQISLVELTGETRKGIRVLASKLKTTDNIDTLRPLLLKMYKSGDTSIYTQHQVHLSLSLSLFYKDFYFGLLKKSLSFLFYIGV